ncbi:MAG: 50S ribosomal protein L29 [Thermoleophilaceae bacterium]|nr:50S ribosomal protein L29 [Thermoleophilaceae bacterium]
MAKVATKDIAEMKDDQLVHYIKDSREELFNLRFRHATGELENTSSIKEAKRALARGLTIANQRKIDVKSEIQRG